MGKIFSLAAILIAVQVSISFGSVLDICEAQYLAPNRNVSDLVASYQQMSCEQSTDHPEVTALANQIYDVLSNLEGSTSTSTLLLPNQPDAELLSEQMNILAARLTEIRRSEPPPSQGGMDLGAFAAKYPTGVGNKSFEEYFTDAKSVMAKTRTGREVLKCWEETKSSYAAEQISGKDDKGLALFNLVELTTQGAAYQNTDGYNRNAEFVRRINIGKTFEPAQFLHILTHEMRHGCDSGQVEMKVELREKRSALQAIDRACTASALFSMESELTPQQKETLNRCRNSETTKSLFADFSELQRRMSEESVKAECSGHKAHVDFFAELAAMAPSYVCNLTMRTARYDYRIVTEGDYFGTMEQDFRNGDFAGRLIEFYSGKTISPGDVCEIHGDSLSRDHNGYPVPAARLREVLSEAGCPVR